MKKVIICLGFLSAVVSISSVAYSQIATTPTDFRSGCCSHHGGVAYCGKSGYYICNDGTQSPSCRCR